VTADAILLASDHAGFALKGALKDALAARGLAVLDLGPNNDDSIDYPDMAEMLVQAFRAGKGDRGVLICGTGIGIGIAANRYPDIRAATCQDATSARLARAHNDANVLCLGARIVGPQVALDCVDAFLKTPFEGGRHQRRVAKLGGPSS
jgi:ribose 5-phosphate isomerase B